MQIIEAPGLKLSGIADITRRDFIVGGGAALLLAGCGNSDPDNSSGETRSVEGPMGAVELPENPERMVAMYATDIDVALVLELPIVGGSTARGTGGDEAFAYYQPEGELEGVEKLATYPTPNYEQIAAVGPDCIIDSTTDDKKQYERLSEIAPTFNYSGILNVGEESRAEWRNGFRAVARAFRKETLADRFMAEYDKRTADLRSRIKERWEGATFAFVGSYEAASVWVSDRNMHLGRIVSEDLDLEFASIVPDNYNVRPNLSVERLDDIDADILFVRIEPSATGEGRDREFIGPVQESPLWQRLPAVEQGQVYEYNSELFYASPLTAMTFLEDVIADQLLA